MSEPSEKKNPSSAPTISIRTLLLFFAGLLAGLTVGYFVFTPQNATAVTVDQATAKPTPAEIVAAGTPASGTPAAASRKPLPKPAIDIEGQLGTLPWENERDYLAYMTTHTRESPDFLKARYKLAQKFIASRELEGVAIEGFLRAPREKFVRQFNLARAYDNVWLSIGYGATITDPAVVSMMTTTLDVKPSHRVLEIGTGSGYQSAILSSLSDYVFSIEILKPLAKETDELYTSLSTDYPQYNNIRRKNGDGYFGWEEFGPFDRIIVTCAIDHLPPPLLRQLAPGGIMVVPLGPPSRQHIMEVKKMVDASGNEVLRRRDVYNGLGVKFIPFKDEKGSNYSSTKK